MSEQWREDARCLGVAPKVFFAEGKGESLAEAKRVCSDCEVREQCLTYAIDTHRWYGVWGGMSPRERKRERARRNKERRAAA